MSQLVEDKLEIIKNSIESYNDFPKQGVIFRDIFSVLRKPKVASLLYSILCDKAKRFDPPVDCIAGLDARGFLFGTIIAKELEVPFIPIRKKGKLPGAVQSVHYQLEYREDEVEIQNESIKAGHRVLIVDDLLATGGTLAAAVELIKKFTADVSCLVVIELTDLEGRKKLDIPLNLDIPIANMKYLCFVLLLVVVRQNEGKATVSDMRGAEYVCYRETSLNKEDVPDLGNFKAQNEDNENNRKMLKCMFTKMGVLNGQGNIDLQGFDNFVNIVLEEVNADEAKRVLVTNALQQCKFTQGESGGEIGLKFKNCLQGAIANMQTNI